MDIQLTDVWSSLRAQYPDAIEATNQPAEKLVASGARILFGTKIQAFGNEIQIDILRRAADGVGWDVIEVERPQIIYDEQIKKMRAAALALDAAGIRIYSFIYLSANPESQADEAASRWVYANVSRDVLGPKASQP